MGNTNTLQPQLDLDHAPALEQAMRSLFESRWSRWHPKPYDQAIQDPITRQLLCKAVQHLRGTFLPPAGSPQRRR